MENISMIVDCETHSYRMIATTTHEQYRSDGFYISPGPVLPPDVIAAAERGHDNILRQRHDTGVPPESGPYAHDPDDPNVLVKVVSANIASKDIQALFCHETLGRFVAEVTGAKAVQIWCSNMLAKPPAPESEVTPTQIGWHQDWSYWEAWEEGSELLTAWVALSDVREDSGPMMFLRGSHKNGYVEGLSDFHGQDIDRIEASLRDTDGLEWDVVPAILPPGGVSVHDCLTFHGSYLNHSAYPRKSLALHMRTENSRPAGGKPEGHARDITDHHKNPVIFGDPGSLPYD